MIVGMTIKDAIAGLIGSVSVVFMFELAAILLAALFFGIIVMFELIADTKLVKDTRERRLERKNTKVKKNKKILNESGSPDDYGWDGK